MGNKVTKQDQSPTSAPSQIQQNSPVEKEKKKSHFSKLLSGLQLCPHKSGRISSKKTKENVPPPKPPLRNQADKAKEGINGIKSQEWTEVALRVPETPFSETLPMSSKERSKNGGPVPPPRKHKLKIQEILESPKQAKNLENSSPVPVDEPIIIPKKVVEHVCDGHHHHVKNIVDGKVVDQIIMHNEAPKKSVPPMNKNHSTLSLPSYDELKKKIDKRKKETKKNKSKTSLTSLGSEKKSKTNTAAEKLESYMTRCKSFGTILPNHSGDKSNQPSVEKHSDAESVDSWRGLDDWDVGMIEHDLGMIEHDVSKDIQMRTVKTAGNKERESAPPVFEKVKHPEKHHKSYIAPQGKDPNNEIIIKASNGNIKTTENFIKNEILSSTPVKKKLAPLARFDAEDDDIDARQKSQNKDLETLREFWKSQESRCSSIDENEQNKSIVGPSEAPSAVPRRKSSKYGHSNLLKFIKDINTSGDETVGTNIESTRTDYEVRTLRKEIKYDSDTEEDSEIVPEIKELEASWQRLIKVESDMSSLLETESGTHEFMETSSTESKSTGKTIKKP